MVKKNVVKERFAEIWNEAEEFVSNLIADDMTDGSYTYFRDFGEDEFVISVNGLWNYMEISFNSESEYTKKTISLDTTIDEAFKKLDEVYPGIAYHYYGKVVKSEVA